MILQNVMEAISNDSTNGRYDYDVTNDDVVTAKIITMVVLSLATFFFGLAPILVYRKFKWDKLSESESNNLPKSQIVLSILLCFGGGALLCTTFLHLLPEVTETLESLQESGEVGATSFHLAYLIVCGGFFLMYFIEELVHLYFHRRKNAIETSEVQTSDSNIGVVEERYLSRSDILGVEEAQNEGGLSTADGVENVSYDHQRSGMQGQPSNHQGHSHVIVSPSGRKESTSLRGILLVLALSIHEIFEGLAIGLEQTSGGVYNMFGAVAAHKLVLALCVGFEMVAAGSKMAAIIVSVLVFSVVSPIGIGIGIGLCGSGTNGDGVLSVTLQGIATGTLIYVVFFEILTQERDTGRVSGLVQLLAIAGGFGLIFGLLFISE